MLEFGKVNKKYLKMLCKSQWIKNFTFPIIDALLKVIANTMGKGTSFKEIFPHTTWSCPIIQKCFEGIWKMILVIMCCET